MGLSSAAIAKTSMWHLHAQWQGVQEFNGADMDYALTDAEIEEIGEWLDRA